MFAGIYTDLDTNQILLTVICRDGIPLKEVDEIYQKRVAQVSSKEPRATFQKIPLGNLLIAEGDYEIR